MNGVYLFNVILVLRLVWTKSQKILSPTEKAYIYLHLLHVQYAYVNF